MDETDRPDDRRADGSWVLPNSESRRQRNHEAAKSENSKRKKTRTYPPLSCKIEYLLASNHSDRSIASEFFTGDYLPSTAGQFASRTYRVAGMAAGRFERRTGERYRALLQCSARHCYASSANA